jgi:hypothetical protein
MILSLTRKLFGVVQEMAEKATQALAAMEKRAVMAESMLEATINSDAGVGNAHVARHGLDPLTGNTSRGIARSHTSPSKYCSLSSLYKDIEVSCC